MLLVVLVPRSSIKAVKTGLEHQGLLNKGHKVRPNSNGKSPSTVVQYIIPTSIHVPSLETSSVIDERQLFSSEDAAKHYLLSLLRHEILNESISDITIDDLKIIEEKVLKTNSDESERLEKPPSSELANKMREALDSLGLSFLSCEELTSKKSVQLNLPSSWCVFGDLLLLPSTYQTNRTWQNLVEYFDHEPSAKASFFDKLCSLFKVGRVAVNAPIPAAIPTNVQLSEVKKTNKINNPIKNVSIRDNIIRSPISLVPLYGDFGPQLPHFPEYRPTEEDYKDAYWVTTKQNGIFQTWAPLYTMFSSGNVTEKARLLRDPNVLLTVEEGHWSKRGSTAVDLFAGIGYFAFSYLKAGVDVVLCWDLNPWSVHGLRRGAEKNKWTCVDGTALNILDVSDAPSDEAKGQALPVKGLIYFNESNEFAARRLENLRAFVPPIRHVNCGMLPSATESISTAIKAVDPWLGGWLHLHEVVKDDKLEERTHSVKAMAENILRNYKASDDQNVDLSIQIENVFKVKSVAPRTLHVVLDLAIPARYVAGERRGEA